MVTTIRDVAKKAKVAIGTVSAVINNGPHISPRMRERVLTAIKETDFKPNLLARRMSKQKTNAIGLFIQGLTVSNLGHFGYVFAEMIRGVGAALRKHIEYDLLLQFPVDMDTGNVG